MLPSIYPDFVDPPRSHNISKGLPNFDMLPCLDFELEPLRSFKNKDDGTAQFEPTHLATSGERLSTEERRCVFVYSFRVVTGWWRTAAEICA